MTLHKLLDKPVWPMIGEEHLFLAQHGLAHAEGATAKKPPTKEQRRFIWTCPTL